MLKLLVMFIQFFFLNIYWILIRKNLVLESIGGGFKLIFYSFNKIKIFKKSNENLKWGEVISIFEFS